MRITLHSILHDAVAPAQIQRGHRADIDDSRLPGQPFPDQGNIETCCFLLLG